MKDETDLGKEHLDSTHTVSDNVTDEEVINQSCECDEGDSWLLSYADLMTLLACFFILMMAFANYDPVGFQQKTKVIAKHFSKKKFEKTTKKIAKLNTVLLENKKIKKMIKTTIHDSSIDLVFKGEVLFGSGSDELSPNIISIIDSMIDTIQNIDPNFSIVVEGHTDSLKVSSRSKFRTNWHLSGARASSVIERFELHGFNRQKLRPIGLGDTRPLVAEKDENGHYIKDALKINRRIVIKVLLPKDDVKKVKLGLGVYFDEAN